MPINGRYVLLLAPCEGKKWKGKRKEIERGPNTKWGTLKCISVLRLIEAIHHHTGYISGDFL